MFTFIICKYLKMDNTSGSKLLAVLFAMIFDFMLLLVILKSMGVTT